MCSIMGLDIAAADRLQSIDQLLWYPAWGDLVKHESVYTSMYGSVCGSIYGSVSDLDLCVGVIDLSQCGFELPTRLFFTQCLGIGGRLSTSHTDPYTDPYMAPYLIWAHQKYSLEAVLTHDDGLGGLEDAVHATPSFQTATRQSLSR